MIDILLHPGFHKTGTSSIQHFLWLNREALAPHLAPIMLRHMNPVARMACRFSRHGNPLDLIDFVPEMDKSFASADLRPGQNIVISCEGLMGHLPGWPGVDSYSAAPTLASCALGYLYDRYPRARVRLLYTTRDATSWLFSAYRHHLRGQRLRLSFDAFAERYAAAADLDAAIANLKEALTPMPIETLSLSHAKTHPMGPGGALCELLDLPDSIWLALKPVGAGNTGPEESMWQQFLELNRSDLSDRVVHETKASIARATDLGGWRPA